MPKRIVDGEGVWLSTRLQSVKPKEYRWYYANWIPLAEANGVFEVNANIIRAKVYSLLDPDITTKEVEKILTEFIRVGLIHTWEQKGKTWGYFNGMDKAGRLPSPSQIERGDYHISVPNPPLEFVASSEPHVVNLGETTDHRSSIGLGLGSGLGSSIGLGIEKLRTLLQNSKAQSIEAKAIVICEAAGKMPEEKKIFAKELKKRGHAEGEENVLFKLYMWANLTPNFNGKKPITTFLHQENSMTLNEDLQGQLLIDPSILQDVLDFIAVQSNNDVVFRPEEKPAIATMIIEFGPDKVKRVFKEFYDRVDDFDRKFAAKNFREKGPQFLRTIKLQEEARSKTEREMAAQEVAMREQVEAQRKQLEIAEELQKQQDKAGDSLLEGLIEPEQAINTPDLAPSDQYEPCSSIYGSNPPPQVFSRYNSF